MKRNILHCLLFFTAVFLNSAVAQKSLKINYVGDSSHNYYCPVVPAGWDFGFYASQSGYSNSDSFDLEIFFGDGKDTVVKTSGQSLYIWVQHTYTSPGVYSLKYRVTAPDGSRDSVVKTDQIKVGITCLLLDAYINPQSNCPATGTEYAFSMKAHAGGYTNADSLLLEVFYGDGTDTAIKYPYTTVKYFYWKRPYNTAGTYTIKYRLTAPDGSRDSTVLVDHVNLKASCLKLAGNAYASSSCPSINQPYNFSVSVSSGGFQSTDKMKVEIFYGDGSDYTYMYDYEPYHYLSRQHIYTSPGTYSVKFRVTAPDGSIDSLELPNHISVKSSCLKLYAYAVTQKPCASVPVEYEYRMSGYAYGYNSTDKLTLEVYFGDGTSYSGQIPFTLNFNKTIKHTYTTGGNYSVRFRIIGPDGNSDSLERTNYLKVHTACGNVSGKVFLDVNSNCVKDAGETYIKGLGISLVSSSGAYFGASTNQSGEFFFTVPLGSTYELKSQAANMGLSSTCPSSGKYTISSFPATGQDFALKCNSADYDLWTHFISSAFVPGRTFHHSLLYGNNSCTPQSGQITLTLDPKVSFISANPAPVTINGNKLSWDFNGLTNTENRMIFIYLNTVSSATVNDTIVIRDSISHYSADTDSLNNARVYRERVRTSFDPNEKKVRPEGNIEPGTETELTYTVFFQNTGSWMAYDVFILDTIDADLNMESFRIIGSSHPMDYIVHNPRVVKFDFRDIMLPDSTSDEPGSHGFVQYKILTKKSLPEGTRLRNTAHIYFDYNPAIVTNTTENTTVKKVNTSDRKAENPGFGIYPNPAGDKAIIRLDDIGMFNLLELSDMSGRLILQQPVNSGLVELNTSELPEGAYFVTLRGEKKTGQQKLVVLH